MDHFRSASYLVKPAEVPAGVPAGVPAESPIELPVGSPMRLSEESPSRLYKPMENELVHMDHVGGFTELSMTQAWQQSNADVSESDDEADSAISRISSGGNESDIDESSDEEDSGDLSIAPPVIGYNIIPHHMTAESFSDAINEDEEDTDYPDVNSDDGIEEMYENTKTMGYIAVVIAASLIGFLIGYSRARQ